MPVFRPGIGRGTLPNDTSTRVPVGTWVAGVMVSCRLYRCCCWPEADRDMFTEPANCGSLVRTVTVGSVTVS
jgi:hypothetical protein